MNPKKSFLAFLNKSEDLKQEEKEKIMESLNAIQVSTVFNISITLFTWSITMAFVDLFLISGLIVYIAMHHMGFNILIIPIAFLILNIVCKFAVISIMAKNRIKYIVLFISSLPYAGFAFLLGHTLKKNPLFRKALLSYLSQRKKNFLKF